MMLEMLLAKSPYALPCAEKEQLFFRYMKELTAYHMEHSDTYRTILHAMRYDPAQSACTADIPFLPVSLFKDCDLISVPRERIVKVMTSSGTTGQKVSKVFLDAETARNQTRVLANIIGSFIGPKRLPLLILDSKYVLKDRKMFSARGAGIMGFSVFGRNAVYALNDQMELDVDIVLDFLEQHHNEPVLLFGYTFMIWKYFYLELVKRNIKLDFGNKAILFHVGGWKKIKELAVSEVAYRTALLDQCGISRVHDYYGMAEQLGSIFVACEHGHMHASIFSDVIVRHHTDFSPCAVGELGILQVMSVLPTSYPGHSLLTEDEGVLLGVDNCPCGRLGKYFKINGRLKNAEIRGCSDTYAAGI